MTNGGKGDCIGLVNVLQMCYLILYLHDSTSSARFLSNSDRQSSSIFYTTGIAIAVTEIVLPQKFVGRFNILIVCRALLVSGRDRTMRDSTYVLGDLLWTVHQIHNGYVVDWLFIFAVLTHAFICKQAE